MPLWGDNKYNPMFCGEEGALPEGRDSHHSGDKPRPGRNVRVSIALAACSLAFFHPVTGKRMSFQHVSEGDIFQEFSVQSGKNKVPSVI